MHLISSFYIISVTNNRIWDLQILEGILNKLLRRCSKKIAPMPNNCLTENFTIPYFFKLVSFTKYSISKESFSLCICCVVVKFLTCRLYPYLISYYTDTQPFYKVMAPVLVEHPWQILVNPSHKSNKKYHYIQIKTFYISLGDAKHGCVISSTMWCWLFYVNMCGSCWSLCMSSVRLASLQVITRYVMRDFSPLKSDMTVNATQYVYIKCLQFVSQFVSLLLCHLSVVANVMHLPTSSGLLRWRCL